MHIVLLLAMLASSDTLTGRVTDPSGQPVALATVEIAASSHARHDDGRLARSGSTSPADVHVDRDACRLCAGIADDRSS